MADREAEICDGVDPPAKVTAGHQYSIRSLLVFVTVVAFTAVLGRYWSANLAVDALLLGMIVAALAFLRVRARWAVVAAVACVYVPFLAMALYTRYYIACDHCKRATWRVMPAGPFLIPGELVRRWLHLSPPTEVIMATAAIVSALGVAALSWIFATRGRYWRAAAAVLAVGYATFSAYIVLSLIQA